MSCDLDLFRILLQMIQWIPSASFIRYGNEETILKAHE